MQMKKKKAGVLLMCLMLALTSAPVSASGPDGPDAAAGEGALGEQAEDMGDVLEDSDRAETDEEDAGEGAGEEGSGSSGGAEKDEMPGNNPEDRNEGKESIQETELPEPSESSEKEKLPETLSKNAASYDLSADNIEVRLKDLQAQHVYTGAEIKPEVEVTFHGAAGTADSGEAEEIVNAEYYEVKYQNNVNAGKASVIVTGADDASLEGDKRQEKESGGQGDKVTCTGTKSIEFQIAPADISHCQFQIPDVAGYTGKAVKVSVIGTYQGRKLAEGKDYSVTYADNKKKGKAQEIA